ncbi:MAG: hypothetical protein PVF83_02650 [Anaerolineales bacterium]|jgi:hypothetical protein
MDSDGLLYFLTVEPDPLVINKMPPSPEKPVLHIEFEIQWPFRSVWKGECPTSQTVEFEISRRGFDSLTWSQEMGLMFLEVVTPIYIPGPSSNITRVEWELDPDKFDDSGAYLLTATFLATGHMETQNFEIEIVV